MKKIYLALGFASFIFASCELNETPKATATEEDIFGTESGLKTYSYSFYNNLTSGSDAFKGDAMADYGAVNSLNNFIMEGSFSAENSSGWSWSALRNINHFIMKCEESKLSQPIKNNYIGLARFFRAWFYYDKVVRFGDVPWVEKPLSVDEKEILYAKRDSRVLIMEKIMADLDFAYGNIAAKSSDGTLITKWTAQGLKSRIALFEGTYRKYHNELNLGSTANQYLQLAANAASEVMTKGPYKLNTGQGPDLSQRQLFINNNPLTIEVMLAVAFNSELSLINDANWWWTSATYGPRYSLVRPFINSILNIDGTPYTDRPGYMTEEFYEETQNRDKRLAQLIRTPGYKRAGSNSTANFASHTYTGYQPIKYTMDDPSYDNGRTNTNAVPLMRFAEILLNYAEAKAELGTLSAADWSQTIGALRERSGITGGTKILPTKIDTYLQKTFFPQVSDPIILEVRRERQVELALEGFRFNDLKRWKRGELMAELPWTGIYVPELDKLMDLDRDGTPDVIFYDGSKKGPSITVPTGVARVAVGGKANNFQTMTSTKHLEWFKAQPRTWYEDGRQYLYPIPANSRVLNPQLGQNPGWE